MLEASSKIFVLSYRGSVFRFPSSLCCQSFNYRTFGRGLNSRVLLFDHTHFLLTTKVFELNKNSNIKWIRTKGKILTKLNLSNSCSTLVVCFREMKTVVTYAVIIKENFPRINYANTCAARCKNSLLVPSGPLSRVP